MRHMRTLAGTMATEDVLRVRWLALLPAHVQNILKIFKTETTEELTAAADQLMETPITNHVSAVSRAPTFHQPSHRSTEMDDIKQLLMQLVTITRDVLTKVSTTERSSSNARGGRQSRSRSTTQFRNSKICSYHRRFGATARRYTQPCEFTASSQSNQGNA